MGIFRSLKCKIISSTKRDNLTSSFLAYTAFTFFSSQQKSSAIILVTCSHPEPSSAELRVIGRTGCKTVVLRYPAEKKNCLCPFSVTWGDSVEGFDLAIYKTLLLVPQFISHLKIS